jgi:transcriptional regulator with XRE-family HTH domain
MDTIDVSRAFGQRLKQKRIEFGLKQEDVGSWFTMKKSTVSQWENGRLPHATILIKLARKFNVTTDWLLGCDNTHITALPPTLKLPEDLPPEAIQKIEEYTELIRLKYSKNLFLK